MYFRSIWGWSLLVFLMVGPPGGQPDANGQQFRLNGWEIGLDPQTGGIASLSHPMTGAFLSAPAGKASLLDLAYPIPQYVPMRLGTSHSKAEITSEGGEIT